MLFRAFMRISARFKVVPNSRVFGTRHPFEGGGISSPMETAPLENRAEIARPNEGIKTAENGGLWRLSGQCHVALRTFA